MFYQKSHFNNRITYFNGLKFHSKAECDYYTILKNLLDKKKITKLDVQVRFKLENLEKKMKYSYIADFVVISNSGKEYIIDTKGFFTQASKYKIAYFQFAYNKKVHIVSTTGLKKFDTSFIV